jgi:hypothetical protein
MSRTKIYMHFESKDQFVEKVSTTRYDPYDEETFVLWPDLAKETGVTFTDVDGNEHPVMEPIPGFHVDAYFQDPDNELTEELLVHVISTPDNPVHKLR